MVTMVGFDKTGWLLPTLMLVAVAGIAPAFAADPNNGERLARRWCAPCHVVASNQRGPTGEAPPLRDNSDDRGGPYGSSTCEVISSSP
jgi:mono/diheme cytochrome c family protein